MVAYPDFSADPNSVPKVNGLPGIIDNIQKGYMLAQLPEQVRNQRAKERLDNQYRQVQIDDLSNPASRFTGDMANAYNLERLRQQSQYDPSLKPYYDATKSQQEADLQQKKELADWRRSLIGNAPYRNATPLSKMNLDLNDIEAGFLPNTNRGTRLTPEQQATLKNQYDLAKQKLISDQQTRQKIGYVTNLDATLGRVDPDKLTQYSGFFGGLEKFGNKALSGVGLETQNYDDYTTNTTDATLAAKQLRQFLGDSIQPSAAKKLDALTNPESWTKNPKQAKAQFQEFLNTYNKEAKTYRRMANDPSVYSQDQSNQYYPTDQAPATLDLSSYSDEELQRIASGGG